MANCTTRFRSLTAQDRNFWRSSAYYPRFMWPPRSSDNRTVRQQCKLEFEANVLLIVTGGLAKELQYLPESGW